MPGFEYKKIIVFGPNWVGDAVMATPMVSCLRDSFPAAHITLVTKAYLYDIWKMNPGLDETICFDLPPTPLAPEYSSMVRWLKAEKFEAAIILPHYLRHALLAFLAGIPLRIGYSVRNRRALLSNPLAYSDELRKKHMVVNYCDFLEPLGVHANLKGLLFKIEPYAGKRAEEIISSYSMIEKPRFIGLAPCARYGPAKRWPIAYYAKLAKMIRARFGVKIIVFTSLQDQEETSLLKELIADDGIFFEDHQPLGVVAALISRCKLLVGNDSGLLHIAAAVGTKTVGIFGSTSPVWTRPYGEGHIVLKKDLSCGPCFKQKCDNATYLCLNSISVEEVMAAVASQITCSQEDDCVQYA